MFATYQATYQDKSGKETASVQLHENGHDLILIVRNTEFRGVSLDQLSPNDNVPTRNLEFFSIDEYNHLNSFTIGFKIPISIMNHSKTIQGQLEVDCIAGSSENWNHLQLLLSFGETAVQSLGSDGGFEDELSNLSLNLPQGVYFKSCFNCRFSNYSPYSNSGLMGELACFVNSKDKYNANRDKSYAGWGLNQEYVYVQEFYICPDFSAGNLNANPS